jgi:glyoxylase-like metal-dependent hydrolase (beta-lactamase superfamily II)
MSPPSPGLPRQLADGLRVVLAPNPSPMTLHGTNSYILGEGNVAVIDPGPADAGHLGALLAALAPGERISHILVTHAHLDHCALARPLAEVSGAPIVAFGGPEAGRSEVMRALANAGLTRGGEGVDTGFVPDILLRDGEDIQGTSWALRALHTPGHFGNHLCFEADQGTFCGDHVMGWASSLISPPDGDMGDYMASLQRLADRAPQRLFSGHGAVIETPAERIAELAAHRRARSDQILAALGDGPANAHTLAQRLYTDTPPALMRAAARSVLSHLIDLAQQNMISAESPIAPDTRFGRS